jgi:hypothetical protein
VKVRAIRGVCVGPERHLAAGATGDIDSATAQYLMAIGAVEQVSDESKTDKTPAKADTKEK